MFEKSLQDLVKGIRANKRKANEYISQAIAECKRELRADVVTKAQAIRKLTFLHMLGYDMSWAVFSVLEVMSQPRFCHKREGYLAACQSFNADMDVLLLCTNLFKKEFLSPNQYESALAINCLSNVVNEELARNLLTDIVALTTHSRAYVRKKATLSLFKLYVKFPQGLRLTFDKLAERLNDDESSVVSAAVNVICELAKKNPKNYLAMAPQFFKLLTSSSNNWMLIKVVKLLGSLVSEEPRLARKLLEPLSTIASNTHAKSLQYECIYTLTLSLPYTRRNDGSDAKAVPGVVDLCSRVLKSFVEDPDQNLKYLGLVGFVELMRSHPRAVKHHQDLVSRCLSDDDVTIRMRALELLTGMVTRRTLVDVVHRLLQHVTVAEGRYREELVKKIIFMCSREKYSFLSDFDWYVTVLVKLARLPGVAGSYTSKIAEQLIDVCIRVSDVRELAVREMVSLLLDRELMDNGRSEPLAEVLRAAAFIVGEYHATVSEDGFIQGLSMAADLGIGYGLVVQELLRVLLHPRALRLPPGVSRAFVTAAFKLFVAQVVRASSQTTTRLEEQSLAIQDFKGSIEVFRSSAGVWLISPDPEVQSRTTHFVLLLGAMNLLPAEVLPEESQESDTSDMLASDPLENILIGHIDAAAPKLKALLREPLLPVNAKAQRRVPIPEGLDLDVPFEPRTKLHTSTYGDGNGRTLRSVNFVGPMFETPISAPSEPTASNTLNSGASPLPSAWSKDARPSVSASNRLTSQNSPFILGSATGPTESITSPGAFGNDDLTFPTNNGSEGSKRKKGKKGKTKTQVVIYREDVMPAGATIDEEDDSPAGAEKRNKGAEDALSVIDITKPLEESEKASLPGVQTYPNPRSLQSPAKAQEPPQQRVLANDRHDRTARKGKKVKKEKSAKKEKAAKKGKTAKKVKTAKKEKAASKNSTQRRPREAAATQASTLDSELLLNFEELDASSQSDNRPLLDQFSGTTDPSPPGDPLSGTADLGPLVDPLSGTADFRPPVDRFSGTADVPPPVDRFSGTADVPPPVDRFSGTDDIRSPVDRFSGTDDSQPPVDRFSGTNDVMMMFGGGELSTLSAEHFPTREPGINELASFLEGTPATGETVSTTETAREDGKEEKAKTKKKKKKKKKTTTTQDSESAQVDGSTAETTVMIL